MKLSKYCFTSYFHTIVHLNKSVRARARTYLYMFIQIYTYTYAFTGYSVKDGTTVERNDWLCKNKLKTSLNETLLLKKSRKEKCFLILNTDFMNSILTIYFSSHFKYSLDINYIISCIYTYYEDIYIIL